MEAGIPLRRACALVGVSTGQPYRTKVLERDASLRARFDPRRSALDSDSINSKAVSMSTTDSVCLKKNETFKTERLFPSSMLRTMLVS